VGNHDGRALGLLHQLVQRRLHNLLARRVEGAGRLVQQQHRGVLDHRTSNRNTLLLPAREEAPLLPNVCVKLVRKLLDESEGVCHLGRLLHLAPARPRLAARNVVGNGAREEHRLLPHEPDLLPQPRDVEGGDIMSVKHHLALVRVVEPLYQLDRRALAAPRRPDERTCGARGDFEVVPVADGLVGTRGVAEVGVDELDVALDRRQFGALLLRVVDLGLPVYHLEDAARGLCCLASVCRALRRLPEARAEHKHAENRDKHALKLGVRQGGDGRILILDILSTVPVHEGKRQKQRALRVTLQDAHPSPLGHLLLDKGVHGDLELLIHRVLHGEGGDGPHARRHLPHDPPRVGAQALAVLPLGAARHHRQLNRHARDHDGHARQRDEDNGPVPEQEGEQKADDKGEERHHVAAQRLARQRLHHVDLGGERRTQCPAGVLGHVVPANLLPDERVVEEHAHLDRQLLAGYAEAPPAHRVPDHLPERHGREQRAPDGRIRAHLGRVGGEEGEESLDKDEADDGVGAAHEERADGADEKVELVSLVHVPHAGDVALILLGLGLLLLLVLELFSSLLLRRHILLLLLRRLIPALAPRRHTRLGRHRGGRLPKHIRRAHLSRHAERLGREGAGGAALLTAPGLRCASLRLDKLVVVPLSADSHEFLVCS